MIEKDLQIRVADALAALGFPDMVIRGSYMESAVGEVMGEEDPKADILADIVTGQRMADDFGWLCPISIQFSIGLVFRAEAYPNAARVADVLGPILDAVTAWARETDGVQGDQPGALETEGFMPGGVRMDGGRGPYFDGASSAWRAVVNFTIRGRIKT
jgi:hypothetical protein